MRMQRVWKDKIIMAASAAALAVSVRFAIKRNVKSRKLKRTERVNRMLADMNIKLMGLTCEGMGILGSAGDRYLPIDSAEVKSYRESATVKAAEKAIFITFAHRASCMDDDACTLKGICELVCGDYRVTKDTPIEYQMANAVATVKTARACAAGESAGLLDGYPAETLTRGAVLLENDIYWAAEGSGIL